eukprot:scaffold90_cov105-Cylindrotheca_fusiformis.AAC.1
MVRLRNGVDKTYSHEAPKTFDSVEKKHKNVEALFKRLYMLNSAIALIASGRIWQRRILLRLLLTVVFVFPCIKKMQSGSSTPTPISDGVVHFFNPDEELGALADSVLLRSKPSPTNSQSSPEVCFVSSSYAKSSSMMDNLVHVVNESPYIKFYIFTNLNDEEWSTPGWNKIVTNFTYRRKITHSRHGKFLAWQNPQLMECGAIFYLDACVRPSQDQQLWRDMATKLANSDVGFMQYLHPRKRRGISAEFVAIQRGGKDVFENIDESLKWMVSQPDFVDDIPIYWNEQFGYSPKSKAFQTVSQAFWDVYSGEISSWRDQPLWAFMLHRYNVTPMLWPEHTTLWSRSRDDYGHNAHTYTSEADVLADWLYSPENGHQ